MLIDSKYSKVLTVLLIVVIIGIVGLLGFFGWQVLSGLFSDRDKDEFMAEYRNELGIQAEEENEITSGDLNLITDIDQVQNGGTSGTVKQYKGFNVLGTIEIPRTGVDHYRNGKFFSDNYKIENGDTIYITDNSGQRLKYVVYNKYQTTPEDADYMDRDTNGKPEISLTTCTDDSKARIIIWAKLAE